ncbi:MULTISPECIES: HAD family hydrolase [Clostridium]|uniref:HAD family hydrolase n=1 Tax=Clostridium TaxID=1485 RepID=UPI000B238493
MVFIIKNIIFDVDGTLWDTTGVSAKAWNKAIKEVGGTKAVITSDILKKEFGKTMDIIANDLFYDASDDKKELILKKCVEYEHEDLEECTENLLFPHVKETLQKLSEKSNLFIVSNCQKGYIELFMEKTDTKKYITDIECFGNTGRTKGENIKILVKRNKLENAVYVGDTYGDYEATVIAEVPFIFAKYGFGDVEKPYLTINDIEELLSI